MAWWVKKLLSYALRQTGLFDDKAVDFTELDVAFGRRNVFELKDIALNIRRISKLAQLPPSLRLETARVLSLRLTVPVDIYQSSIAAEVDGVQLGLRLTDRVEEGDRDKSRSRDQSPVHTRTPQHRKSHRRIHSPPPYDPGGSAEYDEDARIPSTEEVAKSFLREEPPQERKELESIAAASVKGLEESVTSESSEGDAFGTGTSIGLPAFLTGFLQGVLDRLQVNIINVEATVESAASGDDVESIPLTLRWTVGRATLKSLSENADESARAGKRHVQLEDIAFDLLSSNDAFANLSELPSRASPAVSRAATDVSRSSLKGPDRSSFAEEQPLTAFRDQQASFSGAALVADGQIQTVGASAAPMFEQTSNDVDEYDPPQTSRSQPDLEIQAGDDNISWGSRRSKSSAPSEDLWNSMASEDILPDSLLLERAATPRAQPSRKDGPSPVRNRRPVSPYDRGFQHPGSWPRFDESPERSRMPQSPGSWPVIQQSVQSLNTEPTSDSANDRSEHGNDPHLYASLASPESLKDTQVSDTLQAAHTEHPFEEADDLISSRLQSQDGGQSMYMSTMTQVPRSSMPGDRSLSTSPESQRAPLEEILQQRPDGHIETVLPTQPQGDTVDAQSGAATPRAPSPDGGGRPAENEVEKSSLASKRLLSISSVSLWLPQKQERLEVPRRNPALDIPGPHSNRQEMPGTFSMYSNLAASRQSSRPSAQEEAHLPLLDRQVDQDGHGNQGVELEIGSVSCQMDFCSCRLLYRFVSFAKSSLQPSEQTRPPKPQPTGEQFSTWQDPLILRLRQLHASFSERLPVTGTSASPSSIISLRTESAELHYTQAKTDLKIGSLRLMLGGYETISFLRDSPIPAPEAAGGNVSEINLQICKSAQAAHKRPVTEVSFTTLPLVVDVNLGAVEESLGSFGGLSGVLELSNSLISDISASAAIAPTAKSPKGVRFKSDPEYINFGPELKINGRVTGADVFLRGESCSVALRATSIKCVYREAGAVAVVEQVSISGPHVALNDHAPLFIDLGNIRLEYLLSPQDKDLERLISLLTPSKDKYDNDDDILIDTLLRQRRKGAVLKISIANVKLRLAEYECFSILMALGEELNKLSAVTKYLPEDDRPGLLSLARIEKLEADLPVSERFGNLELTGEDLHFAHVGLPALMALSIGNATAIQSTHKLAILHQLLPLSSGDNLPLIMARMLGDEVEPTAKLKLFNVCVEYSVPLLVALTGLDEEIETEKLVDELAKSVANLALPREKSNMSGRSNASNKRTKLDVLIHDSAVGLTPQKLPSKALLVVTDARVSTLLPPDNTLAAELDLRRAALFVTDDANKDRDDPNIPSRGLPNNTTTNAHVASILTKQGFASVGSIMAAQLDIKVNKASDIRSQSLDADVRAELLLLETCADSTQTLSATLGALAPPTPPSKQPKYATEPMTIEDMLASFTGDPFERPETQPETLFDVAEEQGEELDVPLNESTADDPMDELLVESEMTSSLYGPASGMLEGVDKPEDDELDSKELSETAESLLEEDPFEMPLSPTSVRLSDSALLRDLAKQCRPVVSDEAVELGMYEIEDLGLDGSGIGIRSDSYGANTSAPSRRKLQVPNEQQVYPLRLRIRDVHVIWNLYDGYDWQKTRDGIAEAVEQVEIRAEERQARRRQARAEVEDDEPVIGDFLFNSIYVGVPADHDAQELRRQINRGIDDLVSETESVPVSGMSRPTTYSGSGYPARQRKKRRLKLERSKAHKIAFELKGVSADILVLSPDSKDLTSCVDVRIRDFEIFDNVPTSTWRKFLTTLESGPGSREMAKPMIHAELLNMRTLQDFAASEIVMHVSVLPLRLHVDQDALDFVTRFFEFKDDSMEGSGSSGEQPFLQRIEVDTVDLQLDYKPKHVDYAGLRSGHTTEFMNFITLDAANIRLKHAIVYGLRGFEPLHKTLNDIWMPDIRNNQLPTILAGLAPVRSLVNIGSGVRNVVAIPVREYMRDGRIVRSIQKGAFHFGKTTASELARLGAKVAIGTQNILSGAEEFLSPSSSSPSSRPGVGRRAPTEQGWHDLGSDDEDHDHRAISAYSNQPPTVWAGLRSARRHLEHDLLTARDALIAVQGEVMDSRTAGGAAMAVARTAPTVILRPVIGASRAVGTTLLGVGNQIDRSNLRRMEDKYKKR